MDIMNPVVVLAPLILGVLVRGIISRIEQAKWNSCDSAGIEPIKPPRKPRPPRRIVAEKSIKQRRKPRAPRRIVEKRPIKMRGKFPEWARQLSERELFDLVYTSLRDRPMEEAIKITSGGETIWLSGHRTDKDIGYSDDGRDLIPVVVYYN